MAEETTPKDVIKILEAAGAKIRLACKEANEAIERLGEEGKGYEVLLGTLLSNDPNSSTDFIDLTCFDAVDQFSVPPEKPSYNYQLDDDNRIIRSEYDYAKLDEYYQAMVHAVTCPPGYTLKIFRRHGKKPRPVCVKLRY